MKYKPRTKPFKHQARATLKAVRHRNLAVFFEPRLGKTKVALDYSGILALKGECHKVLVLAPSVALDVWQSQLRTHFPLTYSVEDFEYQYPRVVRDDNPHEVKFFLAGREETFRAVRAATNLQRPKQREIERWDPDVIVVDESHEYKRPGGRAAQDCWRLVRRLRKRREDGRPYVLLLTGTPNPKGWRDLFAQFRVMDETLLGTNAGDFDEEYVVRGEGRRRWAILRYNNLPKLQAIIDQNSIACTAKQAGLDGKLFWQLLPVTLPAHVKELYDELATELIATTAAGTVVDAANSGVLRLRLAQLTSGFTTDGEEIHRAKVERLKRYAEMLHSQGEALVVCCRFTSEIDACVDVLRVCGYVPQVLDGRTPRKDRAQIIQAFQSGPDIPVLVTQHRAGSLAIELTRAAEVVFPTLPDDWVSFWQCLNRLRGPNQHRPVRVTAITARGTVDARILAGLRRKEDWHGELMKDPHRFLGV